MSQYKVLEYPDGAKYMPKVWNFCFKPLKENDFWVEPWKNRALADCADFRLGASHKGSEILFFVKDSELVRFLSDTPSQLYLYGTYNQINVCQMRAKGLVALVVDHPETESLKERLRGRITRRVGAFINKLSQEEADERFAILEGGQMFCFRPVEYAYHIYERG